MKVRLTGLPGECLRGIAVLRAHLDVVEVAGPYPNRGDSRQVRFYVEVRPTAIPGGSQ